VEKQFKGEIVRLIASGATEQALELLAEHYRVTVPRLKVGLPKGRRSRALGCYEPKNRTISVLNSDVFRQPFVILHEFYHHLRTKVDLEHKGTEKNADNFAREFIEAYRSEKLGLFTK
jgi:hypothetical protein